MPQQTSQQTPREKPLCKPPHLLLNTDTFTRVHTSTHISKYAHLHKHAYTQTHTSTHTQTRTHTSKHTHTRTHTHTHTHTHIHTHTPQHTQTQTQTQAHTQNTHTHTRSQIHRTSHHLTGHREDGSKHEINDLPSVHSMLNRNVPSKLLLFVATWDGHWRGKRVGEKARFPNTRMTRQLCCCEQDDQKPRLFQPVGSKVEKRQRP
jgi:hypothetical protein